MKTSMSLIRFSTELGKIVPVSLGIAPFVPKRNTPLDVAQFAGIRTVGATAEVPESGPQGAGRSPPHLRALGWIEAEMAQGGGAQERRSLLR